VRDFVNIGRRNLFRCAGALASVAALPIGTVAGTANSAGVFIRKLSWAGILIETNLTALFIDVTAPDATKGEPPDLLATSRAPYAVITHHHSDHFDNETLRAILGKGGRLVCLRETADWADTRGLRVQPVEMWQPVFFPPSGDDLVAFPVPAVDGWGSPQASWVIDGLGVRMFHGGDTQWHGRFADIGRAYGPFEAAFLPINGARQNDGRFVDKGIPAVLTPQQAVAAAQELRAGMVVPIHFGGSDPPRYVETPHPLSELQKAAADAKLMVRVLRTGESLHLEKATGGCQDMEAARAREFYRY
jgi:L-ascorbate metabolism protein UlaG (beta-lactamase superfamily)